MAEAEALCDRIAIIAEGNLRVVGTQQQLKDTYGSGYTLHVNLVRNSKRLREEAMEFVKTHIHPDAKLEIQQAKTLHISLHPSKSIVGKVFKVMDSPERTNEGNNINQFLLQQSSLKDVLIALQ
jgi:ABC-type multidrug transport system ATPase subunit